ncbi:UNVERIFIED_CONTAM: hypothetical protein Sradi_0476400 [Sesamum radiatum]|uniref:Secreted protein n=1 Tax=Sesamum radiatum TaxID=300843 RepID=A0AAW2WC28_SESRA
MLINLPLAASALSSASLSGVRALARGWDSLDCGGSGQVLAQLSSIPKRLVTRSSRSRFCNCGGVGNRAIDKLGFGRTIFWWPWSQDQIHGPSSRRSLPTSTIVAWLGLSFKKMMEDLDHLVAGSVVPPSSFGTSPANRLVN